MKGEKSEMKRRANMAVNQDGEDRGRVWFDGEEIRNLVRDMFSLKCLSDKMAWDTLDCSLGERSELESEIWEIPQHIVTYKATNWIGSLRETM